jgi:hypothetical protein
MAKADVSKNVKRFSQENERFCGEAVAQMARNGYPNPKDRKLLTQQFLKRKISAANSKKRVEGKLWTTDPEGLSKTLRALPSAATNWVLLVTDNRAVANAFLKKSMQTTQFPVAACVHQGNHWVLVVSFETDEKGNLKFVRYYDPFPPKVGADCTRPGTTWAGATHFTKIAINGTWKNKFVLIGQKPSRQAGGQ